MTLTPLLDNLIHQLRQQQSAEVQLVDHITRLKIGQVLAAVVTEISALSDAERQDALQKLEQQLAARQAGQTPPLQGVSDAHVQLSEWSRQPRLYLLGLRAGEQQLYTITPEPLRVRQAIKILVRPDGQLQLLNQANLTAPSQKPVDNPRAPTVPASADNQPRQLNLTPETRQIVAASLRQSLPQQTSVKTLLGVLAKLEIQLAPLPPQLRNQIIPPKVAEAFHLIRANSHTPEQLAQPDSLRQALRHTGHFFEASLAARLKHAIPPAPIAVAAPTATPAVIRGPQSTPPEALRALPGTPPSPLPESAQPVTETDTKAALLQALHTLHAHRAVATAPVAAARPLSGSENLIASLLGFLTRTPAKEKAFVEGRDQLFQHLQQQVAAALAKVQTQQLQSINQRLGEAAAPSQGGHFELPVRLTDGYSSVAVHIQEHWQHEHHPQKEADEKRSPAKKVRQWEVFMEFDLDDYGVLAAQLKVLNNSVTANFWAQSTLTRALANDKLATLRQDMEASGLQVQDIQCLAGQPPRKSVKLNYNLVDIKT